MKEKFKIEWWRALILLLAGAINALGVVAFLLPSGILDGGISGLSVLLARLTPVSIAVFIACINLPFFLFGFKRMGLKFIVCSIIAIASYALFSYIFDSLVKLDEIMFKAVKEDMLLCTIFGALISGAGSGLTIKMGGAIDGIEVTAVVFAKKLSLTVGQFVMMFNVILYVIACFLLKDFQIGLYSIVTYGIGLKAVDFIADGFDKGKGVFIITEKSDAVAETLSAEMGRGLTILDARGYYSGTDKTMLYCVVNRFEISRLKTLIAATDPTAFVTISDISEVLSESGIKLQRKRKKATISKSANQDETAEPPSENASLKSSDSAAECAASASESEPPVTAETNADNPKNKDENDVL